jgi:putative tryptophan/tyrosine transport system substrate-binding protein
MPPLQRVAILWNADNPFKGLELMELTARTLKLELQQFAVRGPSEFEGAFERMEQGRAEAVAIDDDGMLFANARAVAALAIRRRLLSIGRKEMAQAGGLIGYGADAIAISRRSAAFVDKILKGGKPADIPVEQAAKFEFVLNLKTAKALGLAVPPTILLRADEVIE